MTALAQRLATRTLELVDIPSVSRDEAAIAAYVRAAVPLEALYADENVLFFATPRRAETPLVVLAGHLDTVPAQGNLPGRLEDGWVVGLGASDMKAGLAVMVELAAALAEPVVDVGLLFFAREELAADDSPLPGFFAAYPFEADLVVMMEPTDNMIQAGCLGNLNARLVFHGESAHSARPWLGDNAVDRAIAGLAPLVGRAPLDVEVGGLVFREVLSVTGIQGGIAANVIPDRVEALLNFRYAPTRSPDEAEAELRARADGAGTLELLSNSPPARVVVDTPLVRRLREAGGFDLEPKQAWTPVAEFSSRGFDAVNLGPGATRYAHRRDERVEVDALVRCHTALHRFLAGSV